MSIDEFRAPFAVRYVGLGKRSQEVFLVRLGYRLSLEARATTYLAGRDGTSDGARLRAFNEAQHRIFDQLDKLPGNVEHRYPDDVFANILLDQFEVLKLSPKWMFDIIDEIAQH